MAKQRRLRRAAFAAIPAAALATLSLPTPASAKPPVIQGAAAELRVLTPMSGEVVGASFKLDVSFQSKTGSPISLAELWVDGVRWTRRNLERPAAKSILSFEVDSSTLADGPHAVLVKVFAEDGSSAVAPLQILTGSARPSALPGADEIGGPAMSFLKPGNGNRVSGIVEIEIDAPARNGINPYVTFYVDKQFKSLKNYPPYTFVWDSTTVPNGYHVIETMGYLDSANATSNRRVQVFVDNPGGATTRQSEVPDLAHVKPLAIPGPARGARNVSAAEMAVVSPEREAHVLPAGLAETATPSVTRHARVATPTAPRRAVTRKVATARLSPSVLNAAAPSLVRSAAAVPQIASDSIVSEQAPLSPAQMAEIKVPTDPVSTARPRTSVPSARSVPVRLRIAGPVRSVQVRNAPLAPAAPRARKTSVGFTLPENAKPLQVAFNGIGIRFDVEPRIENGLPLAPFRQIFEHTGGQVMWVPSTQVVRAVNADREVVLTVGASEATVNGATITLDRAPFIENGRTIVPLSFVGKALDVKIDYDPATGRLLITSR